MRSYSRCCRGPLKRLSKTQGHRQQKVERRISSLLDGKRAPPPRCSNPILTPLELILVSALRLHIQSVRAFRRYRRPAILNLAVTTYLKIYFFNILKSFRQFRLSVSRCEACEFEFGQH